MKNTEKFRNACEAASQVFTKLKVEDFSELKSKLDYCIGSYDYDKNPVGLYEIGMAALKELEAFKAKNPRKVNKKVIADLKKFSQN